MDLASIDVLGIPTVYAAQGTGHPVLLVHGWGASHRLWRKFWPEVRDGYRALAPDLPGWGLSGKPDVPYTIEWYAEWLAAFLDATRAPSAAVVAHSMGATIALQLAATRPEKVSHLVLANPLVTGPGLNREGRLLTAPVLRQLAYPFVKSRLFLRFLTRNFRRLKRPDEQDLLDISRGTYASLTRSVDSMKAADLTAKLAAVRGPTLVLGCDSDDVIAPAESEIAARIPGSRLVVLPGVGHIPMLETPEEFAAPVAAFLREHGLHLVPRRPPQW